MLNLEITLKVNSYQNSNTMLRDNEIIFGNRKTQNYKLNSPIIDTANDILRAIVDEYNSQYRLVVQGNLFEQAFLKLICQNTDDCIECVAMNNTISMPTSSRLALMAHKLGIEPVQKIAVCIEDNGFNIHLPDYPLIEVVNGNRNRIIVSDNESYIHREFSNGDTDNFAFLVNGESTIADGNYIIGCTSDNVRDVVQAYVETKYINPILGRIYDDNKALFESLDVLRSVAPDSVPWPLLDKIEPFYYIYPEDSALRVISGDKAIFKPHSVSINSSYAVVLDDPKDIARLTTFFNNKAVRLIPSDCASFEIDTDESIIGKNTLALYFEDSKPFGEISLDVIKLIKISNVSFSLETVRWEYDKVYPFKATVTPANADDINDLVIISSNPSVAVVEGDNVRILGEGSFYFIAKTKEITCQSEPYNIEIPVIKNIWVSHWPVGIKLDPGSSFDTNVFIADERVNFNGFAWQIINNLNVVYIERSGENSVIVTALEGGTATVRFYSNDNPSVYCDLDISVKKAKQPHKPWLFLIFAYLLIIPTIIFSAIESPLVWLSIFASLLFCVLGCIRREIIAKISLIILIVFNSFWGYVTIDSLVNTTNSALSNELLEQIYSNKSDNMKSSVTSPEQISNDELIELRAFYIDKILRDFPDNLTDEKTYSTPVYHGTVFSVQNDAIFKSRNWMWLVYSQETYIHGQYVETTYYVAKLENCQIETNTGKLFIDHVSFDSVDNVDLNDEFFGLAACDDTTMVYRLYITE